MLLLKVFCSTFLENAELPALADAISDSVPGGSHAGGVSLHFYGAYGCVLAACTPAETCGPVAETQLVLLAPECWRYEIRGNSSTALPTALSNLSVGVVARSELDAMLSEVAQRISTAEQTIRGDDRSAKGTERQGLQKTPAWVQAVFWDALAKTGAPQQAPCGGFTDVGLHTGGIPRATAWPLAEAAARFLHEQQNPASAAEDEFGLILAEFHLWLVEQALDAGDRLGLSAAEVSRMLDTAAVRCAVLADKGHDVSDLVQRAEEAAKKLAGGESGKWEAHAEGFKLPPLEATATAVNGRRFRFPVVAPPPPPAPPSAAATNAARQRAGVNLGWLPLPPSASQPKGDIPEGLAAVAEPQELLAWMQRDDMIRAADGTGLGPSGFLAQHLYAAGFEDWVFSRAIAALPLPGGGYSGNDDEKAKAKADAGAIDAALERYRRATQSRAHAG